jgi:hypothetical protein
MYYMLWGEQTLEPTSGRERQDRYFDFKAVIFRKFCLLEELNIQPQQATI